MRNALSPFFLKTGVLLLGLVSRTYLPYAVLGALHRVSGGIESIHMTYPAEARFRDAYTFEARFLQPLYRAFEWVPSPIGVFRQGGATGITLAVPADEKALIHPDNDDKLRVLLRRIRLIQRILGASQVTLAGVLPSHLARHQIDAAGLLVADPRPATTRALQSAIDQVIEKDFHGIRPPILLFGGAGYIGSDLAKALRANGDVVRIMDLRPPGEPAEACLSQYRGQAILLIDVARRKAIASIIPLLWPEVVLLNETYPEPSGTVRAALMSRGVRLHHVAGVEGTMRPGLPGGYSGAVPCCAAHKIADSTLAVVKHL